MAVRSYEERDRDAVIRLFRDFMREMGDFPEYVQRAIAEELGRIAEYYAGGAFWVAEADGAIVGMVGIERHSERAAELRRMIVHGAHRRRGVGRALLATAESFCRDAGYVSIVLNTSELQQPAMRLYESSGYHRTRTAKPEGTTHKMVGGLTRHYYEKKLDGGK
jgi:putative acetyltransferase